MLKYMQLSIKLKGMIMVAYQKNELISATELAKTFGQVMTQIKEKNVDKIGVLKTTSLKQL